MTIPKRKRGDEENINDEELDLDETETEESEDEETEEDRAFINDGRVDKAEQDTAAVDPKNIIESEGRPKRQRKAPQRWEHPDAAVVMQKFCDKWQVTEEDIEEIFNEPDEVDVADDDDSFHSGDDEDDDAEDDDANDESPVVVDEDEEEFTTEDDESDMD
jgi:hypothetical protein